MVLPVDPLLYIVRWQLGSELLDYRYLILPWPTGTSSLSCKYRYGTGILSQREASLGMHLHGKAHVNLYWYTGTCNNNKPGTGTGIKSLSLSPHSTGTVSVPIHTLQLKIPVCAGKCTGTVIHSITYTIPVSYFVFHVSHWYRYRYRLCS